MKARTVTTNFRLTTPTIRRNDVIEMHLMDAGANEEKALCNTDVSVHVLTGVQDYLERRRTDLPIPPLCFGCKALAVQWAESHLLDLEADAEQVRTNAEEVRGMAESQRTKAESLRRQAEEAEGDAVRYWNSFERRELEAERLEREVGEHRRLVNRMAREISLDSKPA